MLQRKLLLLTADCVHMVDLPSAAENDVRAASAAKAVIPSRTSLEEHSGAGYQREGHANNPQALVGSLGSQLLSVSGAAIIAAALPPSMLPYRTSVVGASSAPATPVVSAALLTASGILMVICIEDAETAAGRATAVGAAVGGGGAVVSAACEYSEAFNARAVRQQLQAIGKGSALLEEAMAGVAVAEDDLVQTSEARECMAALRGRSCRVRFGEKGNLQLHFHNASKVCLGVGWSLTALLLQPSAATPAEGPPHPALGVVGGGASFDTAQATNGNGCTTSSYSVSLRGLLPGVRWTIDLPLRCHGLYSCAELRKEC